jgi:hypothetical protein
MPKKAKAKEWYWEAEQDKIAADEQLKLIRCPGLDESEGLECVGLWLLMLNLMARSVRKGYLLCPTDDRKPMSDTELAVLTGRSSAVVTRISAVILQHGLFSKNGDGIIYSRGMVRKENLRQIRSKAGRKGGLRAKILLEQNVKQNTKQKLGIGIGVDIEEPPNSSSTAGDFAQAKVEAKPASADLRDLAGQAAFMQRGYQCQKTKAEWEILLIDLHGTEGLSHEVLRQEIERTGRHRSEKPFEFKIRILRNEKGKTNGRKPDPGVYVEGREDG